jgi:hypothetical protein
MNQLVHDFTPLGALQLAMVDAHQKLLQHSVKVITSGHDLEPAMLAYAPFPDGKPGMTHITIEALPVFRNPNLELRNEDLSRTLKFLGAKAYVLAIESYITVGFSEREALVIAGSSVSRDRLGSVYDIKGKARRRVLVDEPVYRQLTRAGRAVYIGGGLAELLD